MFTEKTNEPRAPNIISIIMLSKAAETRIAAAVVLDAASFVVGRKFSLVASEWKLIYERAVYSRFLAK